MLPFSMWKVMKKIAYLLIASLALISLLFLVSCVQAYSDPQNKFSITPPTGWTTTEGDGGVIVAFLGPQDPDIGPININIDIQQTSQTLEKITKNTKQSWSTTYSNYTLITDKSLVVNGLSCHELEISYSEDQTPFKQDSVFFLDNDALYQITYLAGPTTYDTYADNWLESLNTFQVENTQSPTDSPNDISFHFELTGLPFLLLLLAVAVVFIVIVVVLVRKSKANSSKTYLPPPPP